MAKQTVTVPQQSSASMIQEQTDLLQGLMYQLGWMAAQLNALEDNSNWCETSAHGIRNLASHQISHSLSPEGGLQMLPCFR